MIINNIYEVKALNDANVALIKLGLTEKGKSKGNKTEKVIGYYPTVSAALKAMSKKEIYGTGLKDLEIVNAKIELLYKHIDDVCKGM